MAEYRNVAIGLLEENKGQIEGLPANPRQWTRMDLDSLKKSIEETPELLEARGCIAVPHEGRFVVLGGNMRLSACRELGMKEVPCYVFPESTPTAKLKEIVIKDNGSFGAWDFDMLANEWSDLALSDFGVQIPEEWGAAATANESEEADSRGTGEQAHDDEFDENESSIEKRCSKGDIWRLGEHRLMCGDSTDEAMMKRLMDGDMADMVFTDPPYGVSIGDKNAALNSVQPSGRCCKNIENDTLSAEELYPILVKAMTNARLSCKEDACYFVTSPQGGELGLMMMMMKDAGLPVRHMLIWEKNSATFSLGRLDYDYQHEPIFYTWTKKHHNYRKGQYRTTIWKYDKPRKCDLHPTMKPVELVANCLNDATKTGDIVLDVFGGSGTTIIACEQLGRCARLMELDPHYCDVILARWEKMTGKKAERITE